MNRSRSGWVSGGTACGVYPLRALGSTIVGGPETVAAEVADEVGNDSARAWETSCVPGTPDRMAPRSSKSDPDPDPEPPDWLEPASLPAGEVEAASRARGAVENDRRGATSRRRGIRSDMLLDGRKSESVENILTSKQSARKVGLKLQAHFDFPTDCLEKLTT